MLPYLLHLIYGIEAIHRRCTTIGLQQRTEDAIERGLASPIRADKSEDLALFDRE